MSNASNIWIEFLPHIFHLSLGLKGLISNLLMIIRGLCKPYMCGDIDVYYTYTVNFGAFYPTFCSIVVMPYVHMTVQN